MACLTVVGGPSEGDYYPLGRRTMVIGRDEGVPIQVVDEMVSRKHCQIHCEEVDGGERRYQVMDMNSANGVMVNGRRITDVWLADNDIIDIGNSKLMFSMKDFDDRESALNHYKKRGERDKNTMVS